LREALIANFSIDRIRRSINHELGHWIQPPSTPKYFIEEYFYEFKTQQTANFNPFVSLYASKSPREFFAESIEAYYQGEIDTNPINDNVSGPMDRQELRQKMPIFYLALRLFLENDANNRYFANNTVFESFERSTFERMLKHHPILSKQEVSIVTLVACFELYAHPYPSKISADFGLEDL